MKARRRKPKIPAGLVGIAGVHYIAFELSRRKMIVLPTTRNTAGYDIIAVNKRGDRHANIQVKAAQRHPNFWPMPRSTKIPHGPNDFFVLVQGIGDAGTEIECFLVKGREARRGVKKVEGLQRRRRGKPNFPAIHLKGKKALAGAETRWRNAWSSWKI